jgi:hypothetical protein
MRALAAIDMDSAIRSHRRQLHRRRLIHEVEDHLGYLHEWPRKDQRIILACHPISRSEAFRIVIFLLGNRVPPRPAVALLVGCGLLPTAKSRRDVWDALRNFRDGKLDILSFYWSLETKQREYVHGAHSWCRHGVPTSMRDPLFWLDAQEMLLGRVQ